MPRKPIDQHNNSNRESSLAHSLDHDDHRHYIASLKVSKEDHSQQQYLFIQPLERLGKTEFIQRISHRLSALLPSLGLPQDDTTTVLCLPVDGYPMGKRFDFYPISHTQTVATAESDAPQGPNNATGLSQTQLEMHYQNAKSMMNTVF